MAEQLFVFAIVGGAILYLAYFLKGRIKSDDGCGDGCDCPTNSDVPSHFKKAK